MGLVGFAKLQAPLQANLGVGLFVTLAISATFVLANLLNMEISALITQY